MSKSRSTQYGISEFDEALVPEEQLAQPAPFVGVAGGHAAGVAAVLVLGVHVGSLLQQNAHQLLLHTVRVSVPRGFFFPLSDCRRAQSQRQS